MQLVTNDALSEINSRLSPVCVCMCVFRAEGRVKRFAHTGLKNMSQFELIFKMMTALTMDGIVPSENLSHHFQFHSFLFSYYRDRYLSMTGPLSCHTSQQS